MPLTTYFALAFVLTWSLLPFARASVAVSLLALFGPAVAALITAALAGGPDLRDLLVRTTRWRVQRRWYVLALLAPLSISALASGLEYLLGAAGPIHPLPISPLGAVVFVSVVGEEIGWRGFALPRLLAHFGPWSASAILGTMWALWHLPLFHLAGMPQFGSPFLPFVGYTIALSIILTFLARNTGGSVVVATLFHGAVNTLGLVNAGASPTQKGWGNAVAYGLAALMLGTAAWNRRKPCDGVQATDSTMEHRRITGTQRMRKRLRVAFWCVVLGAPAALKLADFLSTRPAPAAQDVGVRLVTVNVGTRPLEVARAVRPLRPDLVFMQETAGPCAEAEHVLGLLATDGSDQCLLSRWPLTARPVSWPGPWQPPQVMVAAHPAYGPLVLVNVRLALPHAVAALSGNAWYTRAQRRNQYTALRQMLAAEQRVVLCGDLNAFPFEVDLDSRFQDMWSRLTYGATFPTWLPAARIDQCWATSDFTVTASRTQSVPSDHRAVVFDFREARNGRTHSR